MTWTHRLATKWDALRALAVHPAANRIQRWIPNTTDTPMRRNWDTLKLPSGHVKVRMAGSRNNPTVFLMISPPNGFDHYKTLLRTLAPHFHVVAFEPLGFGFSTPHLNFGFRIEDYSQQIEEMHLATRTGKAYLVFGGIGGLAAIDFAQKNPHRVEGLVAIQTPGWDDLQDWILSTRSAQTLRVPFLGQWVAHEKAVPFAEGWYPQAEPLNVSRAGQMLEKTREMFQSGALFSWASVLQGFLRPDPLVGRNLSIPTALIWGRRDQAWQGVSSKGALRYLGSQCQQIELDQAGHHPELDSPESVLEALKFVGIRRPAYPITHRKQWLAELEFHQVG